MKKCLYLLLALLAFGPMAWAQFSGGNGTETNPYQITSTADWNTLADKVNNQNQTYSGSYFKLMYDISVSTMVGNSRNNRFSGIFDGNGHTLTFNYTDTSSDDYCAPFRFIKGATIKNLHVAGSIEKKHNKNAGGLVGLAEGTNTINSCRSSVDIYINFSSEGDCSSGGFVGEMRYRSNTTFNNCLFDGKLRGAKAYKWGGFVGWVADGCTATFNNCLFDPTQVNVKNKSNKDFARFDSGDDPVLTNCYRKNSQLSNDQGTNASGYTNEQLLAALGGGWEIVTENDVAKVLPIIAFRLLAGEGSATTPYRISSTEDWDNFAANVFLGHTYSGEYIQLTNNISVTRMVGYDSSHAFNGIFDGNGKTLTVTLSSNARWCAPFAFTYGATIMKLITAGTIETSNTNAGGVVGRNGTGKLTLTNVTSSVAINSTYSGDAQHGGLVGYTLNADITGCAFTGSLLGENSNGCSGLIGWKTNTTGSSANITDCLFAPSSVTVGTANAYTLARNSSGGVVNVTNCYYTQSLGTVQGKQAHSITPGEYVTVENAGTATPYTISDITSYGTGIKYNNVLYAGQSENVLLNLGFFGTIPEGHQPQYSVSDGTLAGSSNPYTLTMPNANVVVNALDDVIPWQGEGNEESPYLISNATLWNLLAARVNGGNTYSGKFFRLTENIIVTTMVGTDGYRFSGHFDGNSKTLTVNYNTSEQYTAPFRYIEGAEISNLHITGGITTSAKFAGGFVAHAQGNNRMTNCRSSVTINSSVNGDGSHGGFVAHNLSGQFTMEGCTFDGSLLGSNTEKCGGFVGWNETNGTPQGVVKFTNCLFVPTSITIQVRNSNTYARSRTNDGGHVQMYYSNCRTNFGDTQQFPVYSITAGNDVTVATTQSAVNTYTVSGITVYTTGMMYDGVLYARNEQSMSLNLVYTGASSLSGFTTTMGSLSGDSNPFTLTMSTADAIINAVIGGSSWSGSGSGTSESPYIISNSDEWNEFVDKVNNGVFGFSTAYYKLADNITGITVTTMVGTESHKFKGHFDGNGKTLTLNYGSAGAPFSENYCAPFRYIEDADIHDLTVSGNIYTNHQFAAGIAAHALNNNTITDCRSSVVINSSVSGDGTHGGFVANCQNNAADATYVTFTRCAFDGQLLGTATSECGGFVGWTAGNDWAGVKFIDCIFAPSAVSVQSNGCATFSRGQNNNSSYITVENSYYTQSLGTMQGEMAYVTQPSDVTTEPMTIAGVTVYVKKTLVTNVAATDITPTTAIISWTGSNTCSNYQVRYREQQDANYSTDFEDGLPAGWTLFDNDDDEYHWTYYDTPGKNMSHSGDGCMYSASYINNYGAVNPDNWLVSPQVALGGTMKVWLKGQDEDEYREHFAIYLSTSTTGSKSDFLDADGNLQNGVITLVPETETTNEYQEYTADLSAYNGQGYIAIRHFNCYDEFYLVVDDFSIYVDANDEWSVADDASPAGTPLEELEANTTYEYQVEYVYNGNTFYTSTATLTTLSADVAPIDLHAATITANTATLSWTGYGDSYNLRYSQGGMAKVTLSVPADVWSDGSGYQMLLDDDHDTYGSVIPVSGGLTTSGNASPEIYDNFEYKIPEGADGNLNTTNVVNGTTVTDVTITIPAGIYDWCITNPSPDDRVWIASENGNIGGRQNDFTFEAGKHYTFTVTLDDGNNTDCVNMTVENDATIPNQGDVTNVTGITNTSYTLSGLTASTGYSVYVQSVKGDNISEWSGLYLTTLAGIDLEVTGYGDSDGGWVFIASPVATEGGIAPSAVSGLFPVVNGEPNPNSHDYDLYRFNQSNADGNEWENYKATTEQNHSDFTSLVNGQGYLYATKESKTLVFTGTFNTSNEKTVGLVYDDNAQLKGWNLVGNPFAVNAYIDRSYYTLVESDGRTVIDPNTLGNDVAIAPCTGVMVKAYGTGESVLFSTTPQQQHAINNGQLQITLAEQVNTRGEVSSNRIDKAILSFNEGSELGKFYFGTQDANIYIPQGNEDYAIAFSEGQGEMPLNFKATENGTYTITVNPEGVEMGYLHLIDNMTGADVDLLALRQAQGPASYTFTAKTTDYECRFKLVFSAKDASTGSASDNAFAFISNSNIIVNGEGVLQIVDVMGRVIIQGDAINRVSTSGMKPGVYVLRLINGNDVKVQKIVIE